MGVVWYKRQDLNTKMGYDEIRTKGSAPKRAQT